MTAPPGGEVCLPSVALRGKKPCSAQPGPTFSPLGSSHLTVGSHTDTHFILPVGSISQEPGSSPRPISILERRSRTCFIMNLGRRDVQWGSPQPGGPSLYGKVSWETCHRSSLRSSHTSWLCDLSETQFPHLANRGLDSILKLLPVLHAMRLASQLPESYTNQNTHKNKISSSMLLFYL